MDDALGLGSLEPDADGNMAQELVIINNIKEFKALLIERKIKDNYVNMIKDTIKGLQSTLDFLEL